MLITFLNVSLKSQTLEKSWKLNFQLGEKDTVFVTSFPERDVYFYCSMLMENLGLHRHLWLMAFSVCV